MKMFDMVPALDAGATIASHVERPRGPSSGVVRLSESNLGRKTA
jgi:hypothetical protein